MWQMLAPKRSLPVIVENLSLLKRLLSLKEVFLRDPDPPESCRSSVEGLPEGGSLSRNASVLVKYPSTHTIYHLGVQELCFLTRSWRIYDKGGKQE